MSTSPFEQPTAPPPTAGFERPWDIRVNYKSGKVQEAFAAMATPEQVKAGFSYYNSDTKETVSLVQFDAIVIASLSAVAGTTRDGDKYYGWYSNPVRDTRTDVLAVRMQGIDRPQYVGLYADIKEHFPQGVSYVQVLLCYVPQIKQVIHLTLTVGLQQQLKAAIATATQSDVKKVSLYGLCDLTTQYWGFSFSGHFEKKDAKGTPHAKGEMYFMPQTKAFVINRKPETQQWFDHLDGLSEKAQTYLSASQVALAAKNTTAPDDTPVHSGAAPSTQEATRYTSPFPAEAPPVTTLEPMYNTDDLPF